MVIRQNEAVAGPDYASPYTPTLTTYLYDAPLRILYHPRAGQGGRRSLLILRPSPELLTALAYGDLDLRELAAAH